MDVIVYENEEVFSVTGEGLGETLYEKYVPFEIGSDEVLDAEKAITSHLGWFFHSMDHSEDGLSRIKLEDLAIMHGMKMQKVIDGKVVEESPGLNPIYVELVMVYVLFNNGIVCDDMGELEDKQPVIIMRRRVDDDVLPSIFSEE